MEYPSPCNVYCIGYNGSCFCLKGFLLPNHFIDGGVTGISLLINAKTYFPLSALIILIDIPFVLLGWKQIGGAFSIKSIAAISLLALVVAIFPYPIVTENKLLIAVSGGFFPGGDQV
jgi:uncharacterized membrane-anchored protein YitT (DUF2179 family)